MIGLRILHLVSPLDRSLAGHAALALLRWLPDHGHASALITSGGERLGELDGSEVEVLRHTGPGLRWWFGGRREFLRRIALWNPDVLHVHHLESLPMALSAARRLGLPVVAGCDGMEPAARSLALRHARVAWVTVPSEVHRAHFVGRVGIDRDRVAVLPCGVDVRHLTASHPRPSEQPLAVAAIGPFADGEDDLIGAFARLARDQVPFTALLAGAGAGAEALRARVAQALGPAAGAVTVEPGIDFRSLVPRADLLVQAAHHDQLSPAVLEMMAGGRPVVACAGGGITEVVHDGRTGLLVPAGDAAALAGALAPLLRDRPRVRELGRQARELIAERYDIELVGAAAEELYRGAAAGCQTSSARAEGTTIYRRITERHGHG